MKKFKRKLIIIAVIMFVILLIQACQPTPKEEIIVNKNDGKIEEKIHAINDEPVITRNVNNHISSLNTTEHINDVLDIDACVVKFDADVNLPTASLPVARVSKLNITQEDVDSILQYFLKDLQIVDPNEQTSSTTIVEEYYIPMIAMLKQDISILESYEDATAEEKEKIDIKVEQSNMNKNEFLAVLKSSLANEESAMKEALSQPQTNQNSDVSQSMPNTQIDVGAISVGANNNDGGKPVIDISNSASGGSVAYKKHKDAGWLDITFFAEEINNDIMKLSEEEAIKVLDDVFGALKLSTVPFSRYVLDKSYVTSYKNPENGTTKPVRVLMFNDAINGIPITNGTSILNNVANSSHEEVSNRVFAPSSNPPSISAIIDDSGEIVTLNINNAIGIQETENENVKTISLEEAMKIFKEKSKGQDYLGATFGKNAQFNVNEIRLSLLTVAKKDDLTSVRVIPVYDFIGHAYLGDDANNIIAPWSTTTTITINAIDGSIIDRLLGY